MKFLFSLFIFAMLPLNGMAYEAGDIQEEVAILQNLIETTKKNLNDQEEILHSLIQFNKTRHAFVEQPTSGKLATKLVKIASQLNKQINEQHLNHLFSPDFLEEIHFFNQVGESQRISRE